jgi:pyruvate/2-oxoglutarate dehydrogenase complex dihydrolipoamide acyltransferase (E2) component
MLYSQSPPLTADEMAFDGLARDLGVRSEQRMPRRRPKPAADSSYSYRFGEGQPVPQSRPSIGRRMFRTLVRFSIAVLIGVGATLGWQSYGEEIREILIAQAPAVGLLLPVPSTRPPVATAAYGDPARQLAPMASTLDAVRRSVEQLAAKQEQMAQNIAALRAVEDEVRQKLLPASSATPPAPAPAPPQQAAAPQPKPPQAKIDSRLSPPPGSQFSR